MDRIQEGLNKTQKPINNIINEESAARISSLEVMLENFDKEEMIEVLKKLKHETIMELSAMSLQYYKIFNEIKLGRFYKDFLWESGFIEVIEPSVRKQYIEFQPNDISYKQYKQQPDYYDNQLPYLSFIIKEMVLFKYLSEIKSYAFLTDFKNRTLKTAFIENENQQIRKSFESKINDKQIEILVKCFNAVNAFNTPITVEILNELLACNLKAPLRSSNNRLLAYIFNMLGVREYIIHEWQAVIANNKLILAPNKKGYINSNDLYNAKIEALSNTSSKHEIIDNYMKQMKEH